MCTNGYDVKTRTVEPETRVRGRFMLSRTHGTGSRDRARTLGRGETTMPHRRHRVIQVAQQAPRDVCRRICCQDPHDVARYPRTGPICTVAG